MSHELKESPEAIELSVSAPTREEMFRDALAGVLEAAYGGPRPDGAGSGQVVPVQAAGEDDDVLLADLADDTLRATREQAGALRPPRWLAFDERRVTAALPVDPGPAKARPLVVSAAGVRLDAERWTARVELLVPPAGRA